MPPSALPPDTSAPDTLAPDTLAPGTLGRWLLSAPLGHAWTLGGAEAAAVRSALDATARPADGRLALVFACPAPDSAAAMVDQARIALSHAAQAAFPLWYGAADFGDIGRASLDAPLLEGRLREIQTALSELSVLWARRAIARVLAGRPPCAEDTSTADLRQLVLALNAGAVTLIPALPRPLTQVEGADLVHALEWLAAASGAAVVALLPGEADGIPARLPHVICAAPPPTPSAGRERAEAAARAADALWAGPIEGRPHWASAAEQALAEALAADPALRPLFGYNQVVTTTRGGAPRVDLLWRAGRLVVEIDGYADHGTRAAFGRDRQRDYELMISGYRVLRLTADEVLTDPALALDKLRDIVRFREQNSP